MPLLPIALLSLLLAGAALLALAARPQLSAVGAPIAAIGRSPLVPAAAVGVPLAALLVWLLLRSGADAAAWQLTGVVLWLLPAVVVRLLLGGAAGRRPAGRIALALVAAAAALPVLWLADERARLGAVALFAVARLALARREGGGVATGAVAAAATAVLLLWASAVAGTWSAYFALAAATVLILSTVDRAGTAIGTMDSVCPLLAGLSAVVGAAVLLPWLRAGALPPGAVAAATAIGLLGLLLGPARLGGRSANDAARALAPALGGLALLAGAWAGEAALLPAARLAVFAPAVLWLLAPDGVSPLARRLPRLLPAAVAYLALAGLPLTVGFAALSRLYATWLPGGWVLLIVLVALLGLWLAVVYQSGRATADETGAVGSRALWLSAVPAALAALGLLQVDTAALAQSPLVWAAVLLPAPAGAALGRFVPALPELGGLLRESVGATAAFDRVMARVGSLARRAAQGIAGAVADAAGILEGDNGLLVLLGLLLFLLWIGL
jgi:hypothetical protein